MNGRMGRFYVASLIVPKSVQKYLEVRQGKEALEYLYGTQKT